MIVQSFKELNKLTFRERTFFSKEINRIIITYIKFHKSRYPIFELVAVRVTVIRLHKTEREREREKKEEEICKYRILVP